MSFFNLTRLGLQDPIKAAVTRPGTTPAPGDQPNTANTTTGAQRTTLSEPVYPNSEANGSYVKYTKRLHKHIRPKLGEICLQITNLSCLRDVLTLITICLLKLSLPRGAVYISVYCLH